MPWIPADNNSYDREGTAGTQLFPLFHNDLVHTSLKIYLLVRKSLIKVFMLVAGVLVLIFQGHETQNRCHKQSTPECPSGSRQTFCIPLPGPRVLNLSKR